MKAAGRRNPVASSMDLARLLRGRIVQSWRHSGHSHASIQDKPAQRDQDGLLLLDYLFLSESPLAGALCLK